MAEPWIRVHSNLGMKPVVFRAMEALGVSRHEAMGILVEFWGKVAHYAKRGDLSAVSDFQIEQWAGWAERRRSKRGKFAAFVRTHHLDADGRVRDWDEYAGQLDDRREREESPDRKSTYVYYAVDGDQCKIGWSGNPWSRANEMRTARPALAIAATERGRRDLEAQRHAEFASARLQREWFRLTPELAAHIERLASVVDSVVATNKPTSGYAVDDDSTTDNYERSSDVGTTNPTTSRARALRDVTLRNGTTTTSAIPPKATKNGQNTGDAALLLAKIRDCVEESSSPAHAAVRFIRKDRVAALGADVLAAYEAIGGADRVLSATGKDFSFLARDFAAALEAAHR